MQDDTKQIEKVMAKRTAKNSVFLDLFQNKSYLLKLYKTLHPEDTTATEDSLTDVTITNVLTDNLYNDLGFIANNKLMILVEAQSTWTVNILVRILLYLAQSYHEYFHRTSQDYYKSRKVRMPKPELYVIFTGNKGRKSDKILLSEEFFNGADIDIEVKAKVIYESYTDDIINQYIIFCKVFNEQTKQHGLCWIPCCMSLTQKTTRSAWRLRLRILEISLILSGVCCLFCCGDKIITQRQYLCFFNIQL